MELFEFQLNELNSKESITSFCSSYDLEIRLNFQIKFA